MNRVFAVAVILFCFEIGFFLIVVPWSTLWESNLLFLYAPGLRPFFVSYIVRVAVSGLGILDFLIGAPKFAASSAVQPSPGPISSPWQNSAGPRYGQTGPDSRRRGGNNAHSLGGVGDNEDGPVSP